ncbi:MAG: hypothetical protein FIA94_04915 [Nitrospirae bacterium]|nr:hypothetical protein [Nitrospirota bacterium]
MIAWGVIPDYDYHPYGLGADMTHSRYFQLSLSFPFILWAIGLGGYSIATTQNYEFIATHLLDALRVFVPYLLFAAVVWRLAKNKPYRSLIALAFVIPIAWGIFFTVCYMPYSYFKEKMLDWYILCIMGFWATFVAYVAEIIPYVILAAFRDNFTSETVNSNAASSLDAAPASPERS